MRGPVGLAAGGARGTADDELGLDGAHPGFSAERLVELAQDEFGGGFGGDGDLLIYAGEAGRGHGADVLVVEAGDGNILGDAQAGGLKTVKRADANLVVAGDVGGGVFFLGREDRCKGAAVFEITRADV
jgi:hypothetical protein